MSVLVLFIEPFYGGSHKQLIDVLRLHPYLQESKLVSLTPKKWHWRARCGALVLRDQIPKLDKESVLFCSSVVNLAELLGLRPDLQKLRKIVYFHENQLVYPIRKIKNRDVQYAYNQIVTCLAADIVIFNSVFNKSSFLENLPHNVKLLPDYRPKELQKEIEMKSQVLYFPVAYPNITPNSSKPDILHIVWPHRWEFDKGPEDFFNVLYKLKNSNKAFKVSVLGECFQEVPDVFQEANKILKDEILTFGFVESKSEYYNILSSAHVVVSTAHHEFFGVSVLEATHCGCFPLVPNRLVYPEIYPKCCLYNDCTDLFKLLQDFCLDPSAAVKLRNSLEIDFEKYSACSLVPEYIKIFAVPDK